MAIAVHVTCQDDQSHFGKTRLVLKKTRNGTYCNRTIWFSEDMFLRGVLLRGILSVMLVFCGCFLQSHLQICSFSVCQPQKVVERALLVSFLISLKTEVCSLMRPFPGQWPMWKRRFSNLVGSVRSNSAWFCPRCWWYRVRWRYGKKGYQEKAGVASIWCWTGVLDLFHTCSYTTIGYNIALFVMVLFCSFCFFWL